MNRRNLLIIVLVLAVCASALVAVAKRPMTNPVPMTTEVDCFIIGGVCLGAEVHPCQIGFAQSCYRWTICAPDENIYEWFGETCCSTCSYPADPPW